MTLKDAITQMIIKSDLEGTDFENELNDVIRNFLLNARYDELNTYYVKYDKSGDKARKRLAELQSQMKG